MFSRRGFLGSLGAVFVAVALDVLPSSAPAAPVLQPAPVVSLTEADIVRALRAIRDTVPSPDRMIVGPRMFAMLRENGLV